MPESINLWFACLGIFENGVIAFYMPAARKKYELEIDVDKNCGDFKQHWRAPSDAATLPDAQTGGDKALHNLRVFSANQHACRIQ